MPPTKTIGGPSTATIDGTPTSTEKHPHDMNGEELAAAGLRWMSLAEYMAACQLRDNYSDPSSAERESLAQLPIARQRLESALATLQGLQHELKTRRRRLTTAHGLEYEVASPFFTDNEGRDETHWRDDATQARAEIARAVKAGPARAQADLDALGHLRMREASSANTADRIAFNSVLLRQSVDEARDNVRRREAELTDWTRRAAPFMELGR